MIIGILEQGLIYGIMVLGVYISFKILGFPDLTIDGSFTLGAAVTTVCLINGVNPYVCLLIALICGGIAGLCTGLIHIKLKVRDLLAGIIMMMALYSINLRIAGKPNVAFINTDMIFSNELFLSIFHNYQKIIIVLLIVAISKIILDLYLKTKSGYLLKTAGANPNLVTALSKNSGNIKIIGLVIANSLVALSGSVLCQHQRFFEINMGNGAMIIALASIVMGIYIFKNMKKMKPTSSIIIGSILYKACIAVDLYIGFKASDFKLITAILFLLVLVLSTQKFGERRKQWSN